MTRITTASLLLLTGLALLVPASASAQCTGGEIFCASVHIGGSVRFAPPPPRRAQVVVYQPAPPPPPVVYVQPAPPPPPEVVYVQVAQPQVQVGYVPPQIERRRQGWGLHGHIGGMVSPDVAMGGMTGAFRLRPNDGHFALDLGIGGYAGQDYNGLDRVEVPMTADLLLFLNPQSRLQLYGVGGIGFSFASAEGWNDSTGQFESRDFAYFGGQAGAGLELRINQWFAINGDVRGMIRSRVDDDPNPEFVEVEGGEPTGRETDTSAGVLVNLGATLYF